MLHKCVETSARVKTHCMMRATIKPLSTCIQLQDKVH